MMQALELGTPAEQSGADLPQADHIPIGDTGPVMRAVGDAIELAPMRFGFPPPRPRASSVFNFRSEGRRFDKSQRCLIPASAFFEFTGKKYPKAMHRFSLAGAPFLAIAGLWREGEDGKPAFTMLTTAPGSGCCAPPRSAVRRASPRGLGGMDLSHKARGGAAAAAAGRVAECGDRASGQRLASVCSEWRRDDAPLRPVFQRGVSGTPLAGLGSHAQSKPRSRWRSSVDRGCGTDRIHLASYLDHPTLAQQDERLADFGLSILGICQAARTVIRNFCISACSLSDCPASSVAEDSTWLAEALEVSAARFTPVMFCVTSVVPWAA
jgi:hypothetical protein